MYQKVESIEIVNSNAAGMVVTTRFRTNLIRGLVFFRYLVWEVLGSVLENESSRFGRLEVRNYQDRSNTKWKIYPIF